MNPKQSKTKLDLEIDRQKKRGILAVISGPSAGVGKDAIVKALREKYGFAKITTFTTREKRPGEKDGYDYHFVSKKEFEEKIEQGFFLEWEKYLDNFYGTPKKEALEKVKRGIDVLLRVDVRGAKSVKKAFPEAVLVYISTSSFGVLKKRLRRRKDTPEMITKKLQVAHQEVKQFENFDYLVVNEEGKLEKTVKLVKMIIEAERRKINLGITQDIL